ncbi:phage tail family protein [Lysinibacillus fusiformis]|uniref:phage tail family protein n=1 Tax=Lysinibacillus fusiformis TaxID=28031 RepID=UPI00301A5C15
MATIIIKELKITNSIGDSIQFGRHFKLINGFDLSALSANVSYSKSTKDGANYQRTVLDIRDFDLEFFIDRQYLDDLWIEEKRQEIFRVFNPSLNPMRLDFTTKGGSSYYLTANLESAPSLPQGFENENKAWQKGLLQFTCGDPRIYSAKSQVVEIASWIGSFKFPLEIPDGIGIQMGYRNPSLIGNVVNDGGSTGMIIQFKALASLSKPSLINVNTYEQLKLNCNMQGGDVIEVSTFVGNKTVTLIRNNVRSDLMPAVDLHSIFFQLAPGDNLFRYDAVSGIDNLEVRMIFTPQFAGV